MGRDNHQLKRDMRTIFAAFLLSAISAIAADTPIAIVKGTNVLGTAIADTNRFVPPAGASNVVISLPEVGIIQKGWRYDPVNKAFLDPDGKPIANGLAAWLAISKKIDKVIATCDSIQSQAATADANWASADKDKVLRGVMNAVADLSEVIERLVILQGEQLKGEKPQ